ncbi:hypothetical protein GTW38_27815 [Streptomyces sp. SID7804]|uniref:Uncharacterized protein n=1 Tax=Streptomyces calvus TaxID=67282 RepID=A0A514JKK3_9ACTN|nr:hypothetical protein [Streptomyces sp. SID7804]MYS30656.1 hypothetical protein [Streptomyces sp. SID7804]QDI67408.1 hypothetical protein CD934_01000 [Streptomyces calvus]
MRRTRDRAELLGAFDGGVESMTSRTRPVPAAMTITRPARNTAFLEPDPGQRVGSAEGLVLSRIAWPTAWRRERPTRPAGGCTSSAARAARRGLTADRQRLTADG